MIFTKTIDIDISRQCLCDVIKLHEGDVNGAQLQIRMFNNGIAFSVENYSVKYDAVIAGYLAEEDAVATVSTNIITVPITENMCAKAGMLEIDVKIIEGNGSSAKTLFLQRLEAFVQRRVIGEDVIIDVSGTTIGQKITALEAKFPIQTSDIADGAVKTAKINGRAVTSEKIGLGEIKTANIDDGAVTADELAAGAVTTGKIGTGAVTDTKLAVSGVRKVLENSYEEIANDPVNGLSSVTGLTGWKGKIVRSASSENFFICYDVASTSDDPYLYWRPLPDMSDKANLLQLTGQFSTSKNYEKGDYCLYQDTFYRFTARHNKTAWTGTDVEAVKVYDEISKTNNTVGGLVSSFDCLYTGTPASGTVLFTSADVSDGVISYSFVATANSGYISLYDSNDTVLVNIGKTSQSVAQTDYSLDGYELPAGFAYAKSSGRIAVKYITDGVREIAEVKGSVLLKADLLQLAAKFSTNKNYEKGDYCSYQSVFYRFTARHNKTAWTGTDVEAVKVYDEISKTNNTVGGLVSSFDCLYTGTPASGTVLFTSADVSDGVISYSFVATADSGYISLYDSNDTVLVNIGKTSSSIERFEYSLDGYKLPAGFAYAKSSGRMIVKYITNGNREIAETNTKLDLGLNHTFAIRKPRVTIIDDDGQTAFYTLLLPFIQQYHVPIVSAYSADKNGWWQSGSSYMTIEQMREVEAAGGEIITHGQDSLASFSTIEEAEANVLLSKNNLKALGFKDFDYYVYPTGTNNEEIRSMISKHFKCAMTTFDKAKSDVARTNRKCIGTYMLKRCHCGGSNYDAVVTTGRYANLDTSKMEYFKELITEACENNSWLILYTHSFAMATGTQPTDGVTQIERLAEIIEYILDLKAGTETISGVSNTTDIDIVGVREAFEMFGNSMQAGDYLGEEFNEDLTYHSIPGCAVNKLGQYDFPSGNAL